jgi:hypothetical protein
MPCHHYRVVTCWTVEAAAEEVAAIAREPESLVRWWPAVFLNVAKLESARDFGVGSVVQYRTKGWLPYTARFYSRIQELAYPHRCRVLVWGDFKGELNCQIQQVGSRSRIRFDWDVRAQKPLLRYLSFLFKPIFHWNHTWVMDQGSRSLALELARRRSPLSLALAPPGPTFPYGPRYQRLRNLLVFRCLFQDSSSHGDAQRQPGEEGQGFRPEGAGGKSRSPAVPLSSVL